MALPQNSTSLIRARPLKSPLLDFGLYAFSHSPWHWIPAIDTVVRRDGLRHARPALLPHHWEQLTLGSGISPEVIAERGYRSIVGPEDIPILKQHRFSREQWSRHTPGLLMPLWTADGQNGLMVYRPDEPRSSKDGKPIKYELPKNVGMRLDCPPRCRARLADPTTSLWVTEGLKKDDALATHGLCAKTVNRMADAGVVEAIRDVRGRRRFRPEVVDILKAKLGLIEETSPSTEGLA